jgi:hypothetical protein
MPFIEAEPFGLNLTNSISILCFLFEPIAQIGIPIAATTTPQVRIKDPPRTLLRTSSGSSPPGTEDSSIAPPIIIIPAPIKVKVFTCFDGF